MRCLTDTSSGSLSVGSLLRQTHVDNLSRLPQASKRLSLEGEIDSPRIADVELEIIGGHPLDFISRFEERLVGLVPVFRDSDPCQFAGLDHEVVHLSRSRRQLDGRARGGGHRSRRRCLSG